MNSGIVGQDCAEGSVSYGTVIYDLPQTIPHLFPSLLILFLSLGSFISHVSTLSKVLPLILSNRASSILMPPIPKTSRLPTFIALSTQSCLKVRIWTLPLTP